MILLDKSQELRKFIVILNVLTINIIFTTLFFMRDN
jgi:hypothetical protein